MHFLNCRCSTTIIKQTIFLQWLERIKYLEMFRYYVQVILCWLHFVLHNAQFPAPLFCHLLLNVLQPVSWQHVHGKNRIKNQQT